MGVFESARRTPSVSIAKERIRTLVIADRVKCKPDTYETLCRELYRTIAKYMKVKEEQFDVEITRSHIFITLTGEES